MHLETVAADDEPRLKKEAVPKKKSAKPIAAKEQFKRDMKPLERQRLICKVKTEASEKNRLTKL